MNCQSAGWRNEKLPVTFESKRGSPAAGAGDDVGGLWNRAEDAGEGGSTRAGDAVPE